MQRPVVHSRRPVLIVGAGPTGLALGNCLAAHGIRFDIVDRKARPSRDSKALAINVLSRFQLGLLGLSSVGAQGHGLARLNLLHGGRRMMTADFGRLDFEVRELVAQPQAQTERELVACLGARGVGVSWETSLIDLIPTEHSVVARLGRADGEAFEREYAYVVGCDGKHSVVREWLGISLDGHDYPVHFTLGDYRVHWSLAQRQAYYFVYPHTFFIAVPLSGGEWRIVVKRDGPHDPSVPPDPLDIPSQVNQLWGSQVGFSSPSWLSKAPFYLRQTASLGGGRVFICGDAAHLFSPIGGTGMNTGMQDALNLGWKLAYVIQGRAAAGTLLPTYASERLPVIAQNARATDLSTRAICGLGLEPRSLEAWLPIMRNRTRIRHELPNGFSGLAVKYPSSDASIDTRSEHLTGSPCAGLLGIVSGYRRAAMTHFRVLACAERARLARNAEALLRLERLCRAAFGDGVEFTAVASDLTRGSASELASRHPLRVVGGKGLPGMSARENHVLVVRPDGFVSHVSPLDQAWTVERHLSRLLLRAANAAGQQRAL